MTGICVKTKVRKNCNFIRYGKKVRKNCNFIRYEEKGADRIFRELGASKMFVNYL